MDTTLQPVFKKHQFPQWLLTLVTECNKEKEIIPQPLSRNDLDFFATPFFFIYRMFPILIDDQTKDKNGKPLPVLILWKMTADID